MKMKISWPFGRRKAAKRNPGEGQQEHQVLTRLIQDLRREKAECEKARLGLMDTLQEQYLLLESQKKNVRCLSASSGFELDQLEKVNGINQEKRKSGYNSMYPQ